MKKILITCTMLSAALCLSATDASANSENGSGNSKKEQMKEDIQKRKELHKQYQEEHKDLQERYKKEYGEQRAPQKEEQGKDTPESFSDQMDGMYDRIKDSVENPQE